MKIGFLVMAVVVFTSTPTAYFHGSPVDHKKSPHLETEGSKVTF